MKDPSSGKENCDLNDVGRRTFLFAALFAAGATAAIVTGKTDLLARQSRKNITWKMTSFLGENLEDKVILYKVHKMIGDRIKEMTGDRFVIEVDTTGNISTEDILDKVHEGDAQCGFGGIYYNKERYRPLYFGSAVPFGLNPQEQIAWLSYRKNGEERTYIQSLYQEIGLNVILFPVGATGGQMGGWFRERINSVADFKGLTMRIPGLGADVLTDYFGINTDRKIFGEPLPVERIADELKKDTIQAAEWNGPHDDFQLNLHRADARYYYYPGWWEPSATFDMQVNLDAWNALPLEYQEIFKAACSETYSRILSEYNWQNSIYLKRMREMERSGDIEILPFPGEVLEKAREGTKALLKKYDKNKKFAQVHREWEDFKKQIRSWSELSNLPEEFLYG